VKDFCLFHNAILAPYHMFFRRYVDDVMGSIAYDSRDPMSLRMANRIIDHLHHNTYHPNMILKEEPSTGWWPYLESIINLAPTGPMNIRFNVKNIEPLASTGSVKFLTIQHRHSFMSANNAVMRIYGALHRLRNSVDQPLFQLRSLFELLIVFRSQGYTTRMFNTALRRFAKSTREPVWNLMREIIIRLF